MTAYALSQPGLPADQDHRPCQRPAGRATLVLSAFPGKGVLMAPHCDSMDGPVVTAARKALESQDVSVVLPFVQEAGEEEVIRAFQATQRARRLGAEAEDVADLYFFETVVRIHRAGEGAPYTGLKPAGLDQGPVIPVAEKAIQSGRPDQLKDLLAEHVRDEVQHRFDQLMQLRPSAGKDVKHAREYIEAMLGLEVWAHHLYQAILAPAHGGHGAHQHG